MSLLFIKIAVCGASEQAVEYLAKFSEATTLLRQGLGGCPGERPVTAVDSSAADQDGVVGGPRIWGRSAQEIIYIRTARASVVPLCHTEDVYAGRVGG